MNKLICHIFNYFKADKPVEIRMGSKNPDNWRVCLLLRGEVRGALTQNDCVELAGMMKKYFENKMAQKAELAKVANDSDTQI